MLVVLAPLLLAQSPLPLSIDSKGLVGIYHESSGYETWSTHLNPDGNAKMTWSPDHPGGKAWAGSWTFDREIVHVRIEAGGADPARTYDYVPVRWGDWLLLVPRTQIVDFAVDERAFVRIVAPERWNPRWPARGLKADPRRQGLPAAPAKFQQLFQNIQIDG